MKLVCYLLIVGFGCADYSFHSQQPLSSQIKYFFSYRWPDRTKRSFINHIYLVVFKFPIWHGPWLATASLQSRIYLINKIQTKPYPH